MAQWAEQALCGVDLGDRRLEQRLVTLVGQLAGQPASSVPTACGSWSQTKAAYRFWDNAAVEPEAIRQALATATAERAAGLDWVLVVQDTTVLDYAAHAATTGLGQVGNEHGRGLLCHSALALTLAGWPLGLVHQEVWARPEAEGTPAERKRQRACQPIEEKESVRWLEAEAITLARLPAAERVVTICDREGDIFDLFCHPRRAGAELLVRATHGTRHVVGPDGERDSLAATVAAAPPLGQEPVRVPRRPGQAERVATVELRAVAVSVPTPTDAGHKALRAAQDSVAMWAREVQPPPDAKPLRWLLLTTLNPASLERDEVAAARQVVQWYRQRWLIEQYHHVLKSGCRLEQLQLQDADRLGRALATYQAVAWGVVWLTLLARAEPEAPASVAFSRAEWQALWASTTPTQPLPSEPPPLREAVRRVAQLGGFLARRGDGEPGLQTVWRGLRRLHDTTLGWLLGRAAGPEPGCG